MAPINKKFRAIGALRHSSSSNSSSSSPPSSPLIPPSPSVIVRNECHRGETSCSYSSDSDSRMNYIPHWEKRMETARDTVTVQHQHHQQEDEQQQPVLPPSSSNYDHYQTSINNSDCQKSSSSSSSLGSKGSLDKSSEEYRLRRERNNIAVRKSRSKSKVKFIQTIDRMNTLEEENRKLHNLIEEMSKEITVLRLIVSRYHRDNPRRLEYLEHLLL